MAYQNLKVRKAGVSYDFPPNNKPIHSEPDRWFPHLRHC